MNSNLLHLKQRSVRRQTRHVYKLFWNLIALAALIAGVFIFVGCGLYSWRKSADIRFHRFNGSRIETNSFLSSEYGLYIYNFNGGAVIQTWFNKQTLICRLAEFTNVVQWIVNCNSDCRNHFRGRCDAYKTMHHWGLITLSILILTGCLAVAGSGIIYFFGPLHTLLQIIWIGSAFVASIVVSFWVYITNEKMNSLRSSSLYPYAKLSSGFYTAITGISLIFLCGVFTFLEGYHKESKEWRLRQEKLANKICMQTQYEQDNFGLGSGLYAKSANPTYAAYNNAPIKYAAPPPQSFNVAGTPVMYNSGMPQPNFAYKNPMPPRDTLEYQKQTLNPNTPQNYYYHRNDKPITPKNYYSSQKKPPFY